MKFLLIVFTLSITIPFVAFGQDEGEYECCLLQDANCGKKGVDADKAVMNAFRNALREQYGIFGEHAFEQVLGARARSLRALRAADVKATLAALCPGAQLRLAAEIERQMEVNPQFNKTYSGLDRLQRAQLRQDALMTAVFGS